MQIVLARSMASEIGAKYSTEKDFQLETVIKAREMSTFNIKTSLCNTFFLFKFVLEYDPGQAKLPLVVYYGKS